MVNEERLQRVEHVLFGNGEPGLDEIVRGQGKMILQMQRQHREDSAKLDTIKRSVDNLVSQDIVNEARRAGQVDTLRWIKWGLGMLFVVVTLGGGLGLWQVSQQSQAQWGQVERALQNLPPLPE